MADVVILHDARQSRWLRFEAPRHVLCATSLVDVLPRLRELTEAVERHGWYAAGFLAYEAGPALDPAIHAKSDPAFPLLWFGLYDKPQEIEIHFPDAASPSAIPADWRAEIDDRQYLQTFDRIQELIRSGDTYQVNFTYRLRHRVADPWQAFLHLTMAQRAPYAAFVDTGDWVLFFASTELFLYVVS
jgi:para-aminobenzoate synthetase/4-amino-4-deoxychorismate lyase